MAGASRYAGQLAGGPGSASTVAARASAAPCPTPITPGLVTAAHQQLSAPLILIWDNLNTRISAAMRRFIEAHPDWLTEAQLPAYAPDLNAVEGAWGNMKAASATWPPPAWTSSPRSSRTGSRASSTGPDLSTASFAEGGTVLQRVELEENRAPFALMLGGPDWRTLFICTAEWHKADGAPANLERLATGPRTGEILALPVEVPGTGRP